MQVRHAIEMLAASGVGRLGPTTWADLGCGDGTFTLALAHLLAPGSTIHAVDRDAAALRRIPAEQQGVQITTHRADFTTPHWPFDALDGILMANSLHYVRDQETFLRDCVQRMQTAPRFLIVEYDTDTPNRWVPYPVSRLRLATLFSAALSASSTRLQSSSDVTIRHLASRPSVYQRAPLYAALIVST